MLVIDNTSYEVHAKSAQQTLLKLPTIYQEREQLEAVPVDNSIYQHVSDIIKAGWYTVASCSGRRKDHPDGLPRLPNGNIAYGMLGFVGNESIWNILRDAGFDIGQKESIILVSMSNPREIDAVIEARWERLTDILTNVNKE